MYKSIASILQKREGFSQIVSEANSYKRKQLAQAEKKIKNIQIVLDDFRQLKDRGEEEILRRLKQYRKELEKYEENSRRAFREKRLTEDYIWPIETAQHRIDELETELKRLREPEYEAKLLSKLAMEEEAKARLEADFLDLQRMYDEILDDYRQIVAEAKEGVFAKTRNILVHYLDKDLPLLKYGTFTLRESRTGYYCVQVSFKHGQQDVRAVFDDDLSELLALFIRDRAKPKSEFETIFVDELARGTEEVAIPERPDMNAPIFEEDESLE